MQVNDDLLSWFKRLTLQRSFFASACWWSDGKWSISKTQKGEKKPVLVLSEHLWSTEDNKGKGGLKTHFNHDATLWCAATVTMATVPVRQRQSTCVNAFLHRREWILYERLFLQIISSTCEESKVTKTCIQSFDPLARFIAAVTSNKSFIHDDDDKRVISQHQC